MTTALDLVTSGLRETNLIGVNETASGAQLKEALRILNQLVTSALGFEVGEGLTDWTFGELPERQGWTATRWTHPGNNTRVVVNDLTAGTLYLPVYPQDGERISIVQGTRDFAEYPLNLRASPRLIQNIPEITLKDSRNTFGAETTWIFLANKGSWQKLSVLESTDEFPFPPEFDSYFELRLAMRLNPRYGRATAAESVNELERAERKIRARYRQKRNVGVDPALTRLTRNGYGTGGWY